jgi:hypothetical protein
MFKPKSNAFKDKLEYVIFRINAIFYLITRIKTPYLKKKALQDLVSNDWLFDDQLTKRYESIYFRTLREVYSRVYYPTFLQLAKCIYKSRKDKFDIEDYF